MNSPTGELAMRRNRALAHPTRLRILAMLATGRLCPCQMAAVLGLGRGPVTTHLRVLRNVGLVVETKSGSRVEYSLSQAASPTAMPSTGGPALPVSLLEDADFASLLQRVPPAHLCVPTRASGTPELRLPRPPSASTPGRETSAARRHARTDRAGSGSLAPAGEATGPWRRREAPDLARSFRSHAAIRTMAR